MKTDYCVYLITCSASGKRYVGLTRAGVAIRFRNHKYKALKREGGALYHAIRKYGPEAFSVKTMAEGLDRRQACAVEIQLINKFNTRAPNGYNLTAGGEGAVGLAVSAETRAKMSATHKARQADPGLRRRTSEALTGVPKTPEHNAKVSAANTGKTLSAEARRRLSEVNLGKKASDATRAKMSAALKGRKQPEHLRNRLGDWSRGRPKTEEHRRKLSEALKGRPLSPEHLAKRTASQKGKPRRKRARYV